MTRVHTPPLEQLRRSQIEKLALTLRPNTLRGYKVSLKCFLSCLHVTYPKIRKPSDLRRDPHILAWFQSLCGRQRPLTNSSRTIYMYRIRRLLYELASTTTPALENLIVRQDFPLCDRYLPRPLSPEEDRLLDQQLRKKENMRAYALLLIRATGMRIGECMALTVNCLRDLGENQWAIRVPLGKLHNERWVPIDDEARAIFSRLLSLRTPASSEQDPSAALLLRQKNERVPSYPTMNKELQAAFHQAGCFSRITPHRLRHTYATQMLRAGVSLAAVKELLGHRALGMTLRYIEVSQVDLQREYQLARAKMKDLHVIPGMAMSNAIATVDAYAVRKCLREAIHLMEMYRRHLNDGKARQKLARLTNRTIKISSELKKLEMAEL